MRDCGANELGLCSKARTAGWLSARRMPGEECRRGFSLGGLLRWCLWKERYGPEATSWDSHLVPIGVLLPISNDGGSVLSERPRAPHHVIYRNLLLIWKWKVRSDSFRKRQGLIPL